MGNKGKKGNTMIRNLKALGLALFAVLAMGAFTASAASAGDFHSESATHTVIKGSQVGSDVFTVKAGTVKCEEATYAGEQVGATATTVKVTPTYTECTAFGFVKTAIDTNGCTYEFSGDNNNVVIACPTAPITVTAFNCHVKVGSQSLAGITYTNTPTKAEAEHEEKETGKSSRLRDVDVGVNITGITYTQESKSFPGCSNGTFTDGKYTGAATVQGFTTTGTLVGVWRS
jgi:hypothetical protein